MSLSGTVYETLSLVAEICSGHVTLAASHLGWEVIYWVLLAVMCTKLKVSIIIRAKDAKGAQMY